MTREADNIGKPVAGRHELLGPPELPLLYGICVRRPIRSCGNNPLSMSNQRKALP
jgi:hypothetical protein